ncbi:MAG: YraN family protein [Sphingopyxis sp.]|nr:YraN family protein [Sphingopyxis sp.]
MNRQRAEARGRRGELLAAWWLRLHGWRIVAQRQRIAVGEVDLIARRGGTLAFIEVKWRARVADLDTAIDAWRLRRVAAAAAMLAPRLARPAENIRIDVMLLAPWRRPRHLTNVWQP